MAKIVPAITSLTYFVGNGTSYIDLARDLSRINRRLYRQGRNYAIESVSITCPGIGMRSTDNVVAGIYSMGNSYVVHNAWEQAFKAWRKQIKDFSSGPVQTGRWQDFKIYLDDTMEDGTIVDVVAGDGAAVASGEWEYSKLSFDDDGTERSFTMCMIGSTDLTDTNLESGIALIEAYQDSRPITGQEPLITGDYSDSIYAKLLGTDELTDLVMDQIEADNDQAPYDVDDYYGGASNGDAAHIERYASVSATEFTRTMPGFIAPCGLVKLVLEEYQLVEGGDPNATLTGKSVYASTTAPTTAVTFRLVPGPYKGVLAPPMGQ